MVTIKDGYYTWQTATGYGYCKNPTKSAVIGTLHECTEDWDVDIIVNCAIGAGLSGSACLLNIPSCVAALLSTGYGCLHDGICTVVEGCITGDCLSAIEEEVVDWSQDFGSFTKCGS
ncbi:MAG: hypothetical protein PHP01_02290 [Phycisphaerae bacterium]|nr:hypothetical protein [Phycisphaerae bacterium]